MEDFNQTEICQIPVKRCRRPSAAFLNWMHRKLDRNTAGIPHTFLGAFHGFQMPPIARRQVTADLRDPDDRPARLQFLPR